MSEYSPELTAAVERVRDAASECASSSVRCHKSLAGTCECEAASEAFDAALADALRLAAAEGAIQHCGIGAGVPVINQRVKPN